MGGQDELVGAPGGYIVNILASLPELADFPRRPSQRPPGKRAKSLAQVTRVKKQEVRQLRVDGRLRRSSRMGLRKLTSDQVVHLVHAGERHLGLLPHGGQGLLVSLGGGF